MTSAIICEGKTDAILLSYFLIKLYSWDYTKKEIFKLGPEKNKNETKDWYIKKINDNQKQLLIWGAGSISEIPKKLKIIADRERLTPPSASSITRIVLFYDRDDKTLSECSDLAKTWCESCDIILTSQLDIGVWSSVTIELKKDIKEMVSFELMPIVIPSDSNGCLETFLINSFKDNSTSDGALVDAVKKFIFDNPCEPYLEKLRLKMKACLGCILSVMSPDWVFTNINDKLLSVNWIKIMGEESIYSKLNEL